MKISTHNLNHIMFRMEGGIERHNATDQCTLCQETVMQTENTCPGCGAHVVWTESTIWKRQYGRPHDYITSLTQDFLKGKTPLQLAVVRAYGVSGRFRTRTQQTEFTRLEKKYPDAFIKHVLTWATGKHMPWKSFVGGIKNESWLERWTVEEMEALGDEPGASISSEELRRMQT